MYRSNGSFAASLILSIFIFSYAKEANKVAKPKWAYDNGLEDYKMGPAFWKKNFHQCGSNAQSPIDINLPSTKYDSSFQAIHVKQCLLS